MYEKVNNMGVRKILVADDEELNRDYLSHLLKPHYEVVAVGNGEQAIEAAVSDAPSLILLDIQMPGIDGYETCRRLKEQSQTRDCPVIFVSSKNQDEEILKGYAVGASDYFVKPFKPDELRVKVQKNIELHDQQEKLEQQLDDANKTAFQALTDTSAYGAINLFLLNSLKCSDGETLAETLLETTMSWGLDCCLQIRVPDRVINRSGGNRISPIEERVLSATANQGRIHDFGARTVFNDAHCSLLVKNMPVDDQARYGTYKDYLARLIEGVEGRVCALIAEQTVRMRTTQLRAVFDFLLQTLRHIQNQNYKLRLGSAGIVEQMLEELNLTIDELGVVNDLTEDSEAKLLRVGEDCLTRTNSLFSKGLQFNEQVECLVTLFEQTLVKRELSDADLEALMTSLKVPVVST